MVTAHDLIYIKNSIYYIEEGVSNGRINYALAKRLIERHEKSIECKPPIMGIDRGIDYTERARSLINEASFWLEDYYLGKDKTKCVAAPLEPQQDKPKPTSGRPIKLFTTHLIGTKDEKERTLQRLHEIIDGRQGKEVALYIIAAVQCGLITKPTYKTVSKEFGNIGSQQNFDKYMNGNAFTKDELEGAESSLQREK
ncbi:MAG: hypothetical protein ACI308_11520 [Muribaculaceae bacterium]